MTRRVKQMLPTSARFEIAFWQQDAKYSSIRQRFGRLASLRLMANLYGAWLHLLD